MDEEQRRRLFRECLARDECEPGECVLCWPEVEPTVDQIIAERSEVEGATWESCTEGLDGEPLFIAISWLVGCARCHGDGHPNLIFVRLRHPVEENDGTLLTHWTACPKTGEPILMGTQ